MYDEKTRKYDAYIDSLQYKYVEGIEKGIEQGRTEERENSIARFIKYVKLGVISKKGLYTKSGAWKNSSPGFQFLYAKRQISNIIKV